MKIKFGVGMSIGSISPSVDTECINNVTFRRVHFDTPFKAIYVKNNPGTVGDGIVSNILY